MDKSRGFMKTVFGLDNGFMRATERIFDLVLLNLLFVLTASLIVTAGAAKIALYRSLVDLRHRGKLPILATYWYHFKGNWRKGVPLGLVEFVLVTVTLFDLYLIRGQESLPFQLLTVFAYAILFLTLALHFYVYPLAGISDLPLKQLYLKAFLFAGLNGGWTLLFLFALGVLLLILLASPFLLLLGISLLLLIGIAALGYGYAQIMEGILAKGMVD